MAGVVKARYVANLVALGGVTLVAGCRSHAPAAAAVPSVPVAVVEPMTMADDRTLTAEFRPWQEVDVMAKVAGYVRNIRVDIGDRVHEGDVLAVLDAPEIADEAARARSAVAASAANIATAEAGVAHAEAGARIASLAYGRLQEVAKRDPGLVTRQDLDAAQAKSLEGAAELDSAHSALRAASERKAEAESEAARAAAMLAYATIRAPFSGVVTKRYANTGSMIQAGIASQSQAMPVVRLAEDKVLRLALPVPVSDVAAVRDGQAVDVNVVSLNQAGPGQMLQGHVSRVADSVQTDTRTMSAEVDVPNPDGKLVPGMYAEVKLHLDARDGVLSVPVDAVEGIGTSTQQVYAVREGVVRLVTVTVGLQTAARVEILSGLKAGEQVIVGRHTGLADGEQVVAMPASYESADSRK